ncbi:MAG: glycosyltransferase family 4 protein [Cytophagaceae bacterium]|jgi:glycosyltransferase involved in cell wall biosynthesis|nr:glycosyltransferase family 4 protein [Cytophagaceae bacterium]
MKPTLIVHVVPGKANPERMNGVNKVVHELSLAEHKKGNSIEIWGITNSSSKEVPQRPFPTFLFNHGPWSIWPGVSILKAAWNAPKTTFFHLHGGFIPYYWWIMLLLKISRKKYCLSSHGCYSTMAMKKSHWLKRLYLIGLEKIMLRSAAFVHCLSEEEVQHLQKLVPGLPHCLTLRNGQQYQSIELSLPLEETMYHVYCGRMSQHHKGLDLLLKAFSLYKKTYQGMGKLKMIGDGEDLSALKKLSRDLEIAEFIEWKGALFGEEKKKELLSASVFYHTSRHEGIPMAPLEAANIGIPLIVSKETNIAQQVQDAEAGWVANHNTPEEICQLMLKMDACKNTTHEIILRKNANRMIKEYFDWSVIAEQMQEAYCEEAV